MRSDAASLSIALNRFGLGARPDEPLPKDAQAFLLQQFETYEPRPVAWAALEGTPAIARHIAAQRREMRTAGDDAAAKQAARKPLLRDARDGYRRSADARAAAALGSPAPFVERLVHFWSNHFAISADKIAVVPFIGAYEAEAIRPHVLGRFEDLLLAVERHAAMQLYLDQVRSIGPGSPLAQRAAARAAGRNLGLNENLAREILELHTLGVRTGYTQQDVTEFARALTGWSIGALGPAGGQNAGAPALNDTQRKRLQATLGDAEPGSFVFRPALHEPGTRTILGRRYAQRGEDQALAVLHALATAPETARHVATKLARHFVSDDPPAALVERLASTFQRTGGDLLQVSRTLVDAQESWNPDARKFKTPWDWTLSALRGIGMKDLGEMEILPLLNQLGQPVWKPGSPAGFDDVAASWAAPDALVRRVELAQRFASRVGDRIDARELGAQLMPGRLSPSTQQAIARAESPAAGLALLLVSPEFLRR